jgi:hypothetical protein
MAEPLKAVLKCPLSKCLTGYPPLDFELAHFSRKSEQNAKSLFGDGVSPLMKPAAEYGTLKSGRTINTDLSFSLSAQPQHSLAKAAGLL